MCPRNEIITAIPFHASYEANEPLIAAGDGGRRPATEEEAFSRCKILPCSRLFRLSFHHGNELLYYFGAKILSSPRLHCSRSSSFTATGTASLGSSNLVITYSAVGRRSKDMLEEMDWRIECRLVVGVCLAWIMTDVLWGRAQPLHSLVMLVIVLFGCKILVMCFATDNETSLSRRSSAEEIMTAV
jgi:hypothetical protein